jgi:glycerophosphoryl diester phosphodiesterase
MSEAKPNLIRVGHKGAEKIEPGNTFASFDAALTAGVDMIEFDVLPERASDRLLVAHDYEDAAGRTPITFEEALAYLIHEPFDGIGFDVDLKLPGYEHSVVDALRAFGVLERTLISSQYGASLASVRAAEPRLRLGWTVPRLRHDPFRSRAQQPAAQAIAWVARRALPQRAAAAIRARRCEALMAHWRLVSPALVEAVKSSGGELYVWTVDDLQKMRQLDELGVTGVITNDPRLFAQL